MFPGLRHQNEIRVAAALEFVGDNGFYDAQAIVLAQGASLVDFGNVLNLLDAVDHPTVLCLIVLALFVIVEQAPN